MNTSGRQSKSVTSIEQHHLTVSSLKTDKHEVGKALSFDNITQEFSSDILKSFSQTDSTTSTSPDTISDIMTQNIDEDKYFHNPYIMNDEYFGCEEDAEKRIAQLDEECKLLENEVDELERKRIPADVPRTVVDGIIKFRRSIRDYESKIIALKIERKKQEQAKDETNNLKLPDNIKTDCSWSQLEPGQEDTADILDAIPPSASLQQMHYLKASSSPDSGRLK